MRVKLNWTRFFSWLLEQSTLKATAVLAGVIGVYFDIAEAEKVIMAVGVVYAGIAAVLDRS